MALQGETIIIIARGNDAVNLDNVDFTLTVGLTGISQNSFSLTKSQCKKIATNQYEAIIPSETTKNWDVGRYIIELMWTEGTEPRTRIVQHLHSFNLLESLSKKLL